MPCRHEFQFSLYLENCDFVTLHYAIFLKKKNKAKQNIPFCPNWVLLGQIFKKHTICFNLGALVWQLYQSTYPKWWKRTSKPWHIANYQHNVRTPPPHRSNSREADLDLWFDWNKTNISCKFEELLIYVGMGIFDPNSSCFLQNFNAILKAFSWIL